jgi:lipopolysaccharide biosynthesis protein
LIERPFHEVLASGKPDFPFCLCWANENWTRRWDGHEQEILLGQNYGDEDDLDHVRWLAKAFRDPRYIRVRGKPLFLVYRLSNLPNPARTIEIWRTEAKRIGIGDLFVCNVESCRSEHGLVTKYNLDAAVEFAPDWEAMPAPMKASWLTDKLSRRPRVQRAASKVGLTQPWFRAHGVRSYSELKTNMLAKSNPPYLRFPGVTPGFDNAARRQVGATIFHGSTPQLYQEWLTEIVHRTKNNSGAEPVIFINAWNEWAEGNHLEPCQRWGHSYLEATRDALKNGKP